MVDNAGVTGQYVSSEGLKGDAVWGTRGRWALLSGTVDGEPVTLAILDHPSNPGFPTYWHARGYGLFAANPLGENIFTEGKKELNLTLEPRTVDDLPLPRADPERIDSAGRYRERNTSRSRVRAMTPLTQAWPRPSRPRPIVIIGAGSIVQTAHLPAYARLGFPIAGIYDIRRDGRAQTAATFDVTRVYRLAGAGVAGRGRGLRRRGARRSTLEVLEQLPRGPAS